VRGGGCGLVIVALAAHERGRTRQPSPHPPENIGAFRALADAIHEAGGKIFGEPFYWWGGPGQWQPLGPPAPSFTPSVRQFAHRDRSMSTRAMTRDDIRAFQAAIRQTCGNLREAGFVITRLKAAGARFAPTQWLRAIGPDTVRVYDVHTGEERDEPADAVVLITGRVPCDALAHELEGNVHQLFAIGDASSARPLAAATYEGQMFARLIGEPGAPRTIAEAYFRPDDPLITPVPADMARV
jgi:hypothetical protein